MLIEPIEVMKWSALAVAITFAICFVLLLGFRRGRLRGFNCYVVLSIALMAARAYAELETRQFSGWWGAVVWINLAVCGGWGLIGMIQIAGADPPVYVRRQSADRDRASVAAPPATTVAMRTPEAGDDDEVPVHDAQVLARLDIMGGEITATGTAVEELTETERERP